MTFGYRQTEFGPIPHAWELRRCAAITERIMVGIVIRPAQYYVKRGVPAFRSANVREAGINDADLVYISERSNALLAKSQVRGGDVLTVRTGYPGTSAVVPEAFAGANCIDVVISRPSRSVDSNFLAAWINSPFGKTQVLRNQGGLAQQHFNVGDLRNLVVALPPIAEQRAIATALSDVDALIGSLNRLVAKRRDLKQGAMQQLLTGRTRLPGFSAKWASKRIGEIADCVSGGTPNTAVPAYWGGDIRWMSSGELNLRFVFEVAGRITAEGLRSSSAKLIPAKCVLVGLAGQGATRGTVAINLVEVCTNQSIAAILPGSTFVPEYLYYHLDTRYNELRELSSGGGGRGGLNLGIIRALEIPLPDTQEQAAIAAVLADMDAEIAALEARRDKTKLLKIGMMQELLTGRTRLV